MSTFEFPGRYYEVMRRSFRDLDAETTFLGGLLPARGRILDLGCGTGTNLRALAALGHTGVGVDRSTTFIHHAKNAGGPGISYICEDLARFDTEESFDLVYCVFATLNLLPRENLGHLLTAAARWLRPGGRLVLDVAHLLNFVDTFQPAMIQHHHRDDILITQLARQSVSPHRAVWRHEETLLVQDRDGRVSLHENFFDQSVLTLPELEGLIGAAGLTVVDRLGGFRGEPAPRHGRGPLVLVAAHAAGPAAPPRSG
ncbi:hypothetical protein CcI49_35290 [Frankia sp. CcI49]|uniref:class I SAM-dependent methyltransferase n=1 Tax=unclassified Frankia TaxID=2632575 RepID=UPI0006CA0AC5|nr:MULTISPECIES: class I SAM-dependent methyltransferase [unclassified Frankia]ONH51671.1 hypothetical protein CcI49_35290 [Frankia sp. CcI49]